MCTQLEKLERLEKWKDEIGIPAVKRAFYLENAIDVYQTEHSEYHIEIESLKFQHAEIEDLHQRSIHRIQSTSKIIHEQNLYLQQTYDEQKDMKNEYQSKMSRVRKKTTELEKINNELKDINSKYHEMNQELRIKQNTNVQMIQELRDAILQLQFDAQEKEDETIEQQSSLNVLHEQIIAEKDRKINEIHAIVAKRKQRHRKSVKIIISRQSSATSSYCGDDGMSLNDERGFHAGISPRSNKTLREADANEMFADILNQDCFENDITGKHFLADTFNTEIELELREQIENEIKNKYDIEVQQIRVEEHLKIHEIENEYNAKIQQLQREIVRLRRKLNKKSRVEHISAERNISMADDAHTNWCDLESIGRSFCVQQ